MKYKYIDKVGTEFTPLDIVAGYPLDVIKGYFWDLRKLKSDRIVLGNASQEWLQRLSENTRDIYEYICSVDFWWEFQFLKINTKSAGIVPFKPYDTQRILQEHVRYMEGDGPVRLVLLKPRQFGGSTWIELYLYLKTKHLYNSRALIVADKKANSVNLYGMYSTCYTHDPTRRVGRLLSNTILYDHNPLLANPASESGVIEDYDLSDLDFTNTDELSNVINGGYVRVESGFSRQAGRSFTIQHLHASEVAFWEDPDASMQSLMATVPYLPNTSVFIESTGNGVGDWFYDMWYNKNDGYDRLFVSWLDVMEYSLPFKTSDELKKFQDEMDDEELKLHSKDGATLEQLKWRRMKVGEYHGNLDRFGQEFPKTPEEAFLGSGRPVFAVPVLKWHEALIANDKSRIVYRGFDMVTNELVVEKAREFENKLKVFKKPKMSHKYILGVDVSEGIIVKDDSTDYSVIQVLDRGTKELVQSAEYVGKITPDSLAYLVAATAEYYNNAWVNIEANNHGLTTITELQKIYKRIMRRPTVEIIEKRTSSNRNLKKSVSKKPQGSTQKLGWLTTSKTKPQMIDDLARYLSAQELIIYSQPLLEQLYYYIYDDNGNPNAQSGKHDDMVMAIALAIQGHIYCPNSQGSTNRDIGDYLEMIDELDVGDSFDGYTII